MLQVNQALEAENLTTCVTGAQVSNDQGFYVIPEGVPSGTYSFGYEITVYDISWRVDLDAPQPIPLTYAVSTGSLSGTKDAVPSHITAAKLIPAE